MPTKWRIYRRVGPTRYNRIHFPVAATPLSTAVPGRTPSMSNPARLAALAQSLLVQRYAPACVIANRSGEILYFHGRTDDYLNPDTPWQFVPTRQDHGRAVHRCHHRK